MQVGTFVKTLSPHVVEILGLTGLDFAAIDAEHAPFDRAALDLMMLAGRAARLPIHVRVPDTSAATILSVLDVGAAGLVVPHVDSATQAAEVVSRARYRGGVRGFSSSPRSAGYGTLGMKAALEAGDRSLIMCQIESVEAVEAAPAIAAVPGVDGLFIGRADLALSLGEDDIQSDRVSAACTRIIDAARAARKVPGMFVATAAERDRFAARGVTWFIVGSDQSLLRQAAQAVAVKAPERRP
jgi:2-keto-3-deoxy-L-rhamnonate aldolase RhmA